MTVVVSLRFFKKRRFYSFYPICPCVVLYGSYWFITSCCCEYRFSITSLVNTELEGGWYGGLVV